MNISRTRLRAAVVTPTVLAGLVLSSLAGGIAAAGTASAASPAAATAASAAAPTAAPDAEAGSAYGFLFYIYPDPQPLCPLAVALNATSDPATDRGSCLLLNFSTTGATGTVTADLYAEGEATPFLADVEADPDTDPGTYQISTKPDATWPAGKIRLVVSDGAGPIGEFSFLHNGLVATATTGAPKAPGEAFDVTGDIVEHSGRVTFGGDKGVPATFKVRVSRPDGTVLFTSPQQTAASDGTFTYTVPAGTTTSVVSTSATSYQTTLKVEVVDAAYDDTAAIPPPTTGLWGNKSAATTSQVVVSPATELLLQNSFVSFGGLGEAGRQLPVTDHPHQPDLLVGDADRRADHRAHRVDDRAGRRDGRERPDVHLDARCHRAR